MITTGALWSEKLASIDHASERLYWRIHMASDNYGVMTGKPWDVCQKAVPGVGAYSLKAVEKALVTLVSVGLLEAWVEPDGTHWVHVIGHDGHQSADFKRKRGKRVNPAPPSMRKDAKYASVLDGSHDPSSDAAPCPLLPFAAQGAPIAAHITSTSTPTELTNMSTSAKPKRDYAAEAQQVFDHWVITWNKRTSTIFDGKRRENTMARLRSGYTVSQLCESISGYRYSENHNGSKGKKYDDLELFMRDASKVDAGIEYGIAVANRGAAFGGGLTPHATSGDLVRIERHLKRDLTEAEETALQSGEVSVDAFLASNGIMEAGAA